MKNRIQLLGLAVLFLVVPLLTQAQNSLLKKANEYYEFLAFSKAIPKYEQVLKRDSLNAKALINLADCYRLTNNNPKALKTYARVIKLSEAKPLHSFLYAQALMQAGKYEEAKTFMNTYSGDERGKIFSKSIEEIKKFYKNKDNYKITKASFNSPKNDFSPSLWKNNNIVFSSSRERAQIISYRNAWTGDNYDALYSTEKKKNGDYGKVQLFNESIQSRYNNGAASFSTDLNHIYYSRNSIVDNIDMRGADGRVHDQIFQATLDNENKFGDIKEFRYNNYEYNCTHPAVNDNGTMLFFASDMPGGYGGMDIWVTTKKDTIWSEPVNLGDKVNTIGNEVFPYVFRNNILYFSSNGLEGMGGLDIYKVDLNANGTPKETSINMGAPINSMSDDFGITLYPSADSGYFSSNFGNVNNDDDIFAFTVLKPVRHIKIQGVVTDAQTKEFLPGTKVILTEKNGTTTEEILTDNNGSYSFTADYNKEYIVNGQKENYNDALPYNLSTKVNEETAELSANLTLKKKPTNELIVHVFDAKDNTPLANTKINVLDQLTNKSESFYTTAKGDCVIGLTDKKSGDSLNYKISLSVDEYLDKVMDWKENIDKPEDTTMSLSIGMTKNTLDIIITLKPIYFDYKLWNIRSDAAIELDKVVAYMKAHSEISIQCNSFTDCRYNKEWNQELSEKRAQSTVDYIVSKGIAKSRLSAKGYGESRLVNKCECEGDVIVPCTEDEHALNRRTEFVIKK